MRDILTYLSLFRSTISREKFEELCKDLWERSLTPLKDVLKHSGLKIDEISAVELIGGATRVPKLQVVFHAFKANQFGIFIQICGILAFFFSLFQIKLRSNF